jgi:hypothetical protein
MRANIAIVQIDHAGRRIQQPDVGIPLCDSRG